VLGRVHTEHPVERVLTELLDVVPVSPNAVLDRVAQGIETALRDCLIADGGHRGILRVPDNRREHPLGILIARKAGLPRIRAIVNNQDFV
jgi:hypothetical protein